VTTKKSPKPYLVYWFLYSLTDLLLIWATFDWIYPLLKPLTHALRPTKSVAFI